MSKYNRLPKGLKKKQSSRVFDVIYPCNGHNFTLSQEPTDEQDSLFHGSVSSRSNFSRAIRATGIESHDLIYEKLSDCIYDEGVGLQYKGSSPLTRVILGISRSPDDWKSIIPQEVISGSVPLSVWMDSVHLSQSLIRDFFRHSKSFNEWYDSKEYRDAAHRYNFKNGHETKVNDITKQVQHQFEQRSLELCEPFRGFMVDGQNVEYKVRCKICGEEFTTGAYQIKLCPKCKVQEFRSSRERKASWLLDQLQVKYYRNYKLKTGHELDLYIPDKKIAFEFNGYYWHSLIHHPSDYHKVKTEEALKEGIKLYHIWEGVSDSLAYSIIKAKLGLSNRVYARKTVLKEVSTADAKKFLESHHVDGYVRANKAYGLYSLNGELLSVMTLLNRNLQSTHSQVWEIGRYATEFGITVVGGYTKMLNEAIKFLKSIGVHELVSYCNRDLSPDPNETFYSKQGFDFEGDSGAVYWYWASKNCYYNGKVYKEGELLSRQLLQKQKLINHYVSEGLELPSVITEKTLANGLGFYACYNSGNFKYRLKL